jgi:HEAT repeat protein/DNA-binding winged helix-turn-helix (wHTH) protein
VQTLTDSPNTFRFGDFELDGPNFVLRRRSTGEEIHLEDKAKSLLLLLVGRAGELVTFTEIEAALWNNVHLDVQRSAQVAKGKIAKAIGPEFVQSVSRKGYRFKQAVQVKPKCVLDSTRDPDTSEARIAAVRAYLRRLTTLPVRDSPRYLGDRSLLDLFREPFVFVEDLPDHPARRMNIESGWPAEVTSQLPVSNSVPWSRAITRLSRAVVIGLPGEGKTLLTQITARRLAEDALGSLEADPKLLSRLTIPIYLPCARVATHSTVAQAVASEIERFLCEQEPQSVIELVKTVIVTSLREGRAFLLLDALDEVASGSDVRQPLLSLHASCRVLVTSRPSAAWHAHLPLGRLTVCTLAPLDDEGRKRFIEQWFVHTPLKSRRLLEALAGSSRLNDLTLNPLLLTLTCWAMEAQPETRARRPDIYHAATRLLLERPWKPGQRADASDDTWEFIERSIRALAGAAWTLFASDPRRSIFTLHEWDDAMTEAVRSCGYPASFDTSRVTQLARAAGLLVRLAPTHGPVTTVHGGELMFIHRGFQEYLAAVHVATLPDPIVEIERFLWHRSTDELVIWEPAATDMVVLLAACLQHAQALIDRLLWLDDHMHDAAGAMAQLAGMAVAETEDEGSSFPRAAHLTSRLLSVARTLFPYDFGDWWAPWSSDPSGSRGRILRALSFAARQPTSPLYQQLYARDRYRRLLAIHILSASGSRHVIESLSHLAGDTDDVVALAARGALTRINLAAAIATEEPPSVPVPDATCDGLAADAALLQLRSAFKETDTRVRNRDVPDLMSRLGRDAYDILLVALEDESPLVRDGAARLLASLGDPRLLPKLVDAVRRVDSPLTPYAIKGLSEIYHPRAQRLLMALAKCARSADVRREALESFSGLSEATPAASVPCEGSREFAVFASATRDPSTEVRMTAAFYLTRFAGDRPIALLASLFMQPELTSAVTFFCLSLPPFSPPALLLDQLESAEPERRLMAAIALGGTSDERPLQILADVVLAETYPNEEFEYQVARALSNAPRPSSFIALAKLLSSPIPISRQFGARGLARLGGSRGLALLLPTLGDPDFETRNEMAQHVMSFGAATVRDSAVTSLSDGTYFSRDALVMLQGLTRLWLAAPPLPSRLWEYCDPDGHFMLQIPADWQTTRVAWSDDTATHIVTCGAATPSFSGELGSDRDVRLLIHVEFPEPRSTILSDDHHAAEHAITAVYGRYRALFRRRRNGLVVTRLGDQMAGRLEGTVDDVAVINYQTRNADERKIFIEISCPPPERECAQAVAHAIERTFR